LFERPYFVGILGWRESTIQETAVDVWYCRPVDYLLGIAEMETLFLGTLGWTNI